MTDPASYRPAPGDIPDQPGVYRFYDRNGRVIYVGKAKNLRQRLANYFQPLSSLHPRTRKMVTTAVGVKWVTVDEETEALTLEYFWIKEYQPRFNVMFRDDKSYPYLALTLADEYPRMYVTRERWQKRDARRRRLKQKANTKGQTRYFGPYPKAWAIYDTCEQLRRVFPLRPCSNGVFNSAKAQGRPCLQGYIEKCSAPCVGRVTNEEYQEMTQEVADFMDGKTAPFIRNVKAQMQAAADELNFEAAAKYRDHLVALETVLEKSVVVLDDGTDADCYALASDDLELVLQVFYVRAGRIRGEMHWIVEADPEQNTAQLWENFLTQIYGGYPPSPPTQKSQPSSVDDVVHTPTEAIPAQILVPQLPDNLRLLTQWLSQIGQRKVTIKSPQRGPKAQLLKMVQENATQNLKLQKNRRFADLNQREETLRQLQEYLGLAQAPLRIEAYDISHTQGSDQVGSMVVFEDALPRKNAYRIFNIQDREGQADDLAAMRQVLTRRFQRLQQELELPPGEKRRFSYPPDLLVIDGGPLQLAVAKAVLEELGLSIEVIGLAKRLEEVYLPDSDFPVILPRQSAGLHLLQHLRDESHRFAITAHRRKRDKKVRRSRLDEISGLGEVRKKALLKHFGSLYRLQEASVKEICQVPGFGMNRAQALYQALHQTEK